MAKKELQNKQVKILKMRNVFFKLLHLAYLLNSGWVFAQTALPGVAVGRIERIENFTSRFVGNRCIDVWLPEGYSAKEKYAVLYMHDGQMLFDSAITWNKQAWNVDDSSAALMKRIPNKKWIVVGVHNAGPNRHREYFPQQVFYAMKKEARDSISAQLGRAGRNKGDFKPSSDEYLKFLVKELKPFIDKKYAVHRDAGNTFIAGSSMGGLISVYAVCQYPKVFGGAACLSSHWPGSFDLKNNAFPNAMLDYLGKKLPLPGRNRFYFDCGDQTLDSMYGPLQDKVDQVFADKGYGKGQYESKRFAGENHSEQAWSKRLGEVLGFLFGR